MFPLCEFTMCLKLSPMTLSNKPNLDRTIVQNIYLRNHSIQQLHTRKNTDQTSCSIWTTNTHAHTYTHTCTHLMALFWNYLGQPVLKDKTNLDFSEARESEWQWHQLGHMQVCTSLPIDNHAHHSLFYRPDALPAIQPTVSKH